MKGLAAGLAAMLPRRIRLSLASGLIRDLERRRDWSVHDWFSIASLERTLDIVRRMGLNTVVDIGAFQGDWTRQVRALAPSARVLMVEALPEKEPVLRKVAEVCGPGVEVAIALLGASRKSQVPFHVGESGSSLLGDVSGGSDSTLHLDMTTLDDLLRERGFGDLDLLKLDVQGAELEIMRGAAQSLPRTKFVMLEVSFQRLYERSALAADAVGYMRDHGFRLFDVCSFIRRPRDQALAQIDALFVRDDLAAAIGPGWK